MRGRLSPLRAIRAGMAWAAPSCLLLLLAGCGWLGREPHAGPETCSTEVTDPDELLAGCLIDGNGDPAHGYTVVAKRALPLAKSANVGSADTGGTASQGKYVATEADRLGRYSFRKGQLKPDLYLLQAIDREGRQWALGSKVKAIYIDPSNRVNRDQDTTFAVGRISGKVVDDSGKALEQAHCFIPGLDHYLEVSKVGEFHFDVHPGNHGVVCQLPGYDRAEAPPVEVEAGEVKEIIVRLTPAYVTAAYPPEPKGVVAHYDSTTGIVRLRWNKINDSRIEYYVRRFRVPDFFGDRTIAVQDTSHLDVLFPPGLDHSRAPQEPRTWMYNIGTRWYYNNVYSLGFAAIELTVRPPSPPGPRVSVRHLDSLGACRVGDTTLVVGTYSNPLRRNRELFWTQNDMALDQNGLPIHLRIRSGLDDTAGVDTLAFRCPAQGTFRLRMVVKDELGAFSSDAVPLQVKPAP